MEIMKRWRTVGILLSWSLAFIVQVMPMHAQAPDVPIPLDDYWQKLGQTQALVTSLLDAPTQEHHPDLLVLADEWEKVSGVVLPDGAQVPLDHSFLVSRLRVNPPDLAGLDELLGVLLAARQSWPQPQFAAHDVQILADVLARPEFQWQPPEPSPLETFLQRLRDSLWKFLLRLLPDRLAVGLSGDLLNTILTGLVLLTLILVLLFTSRNLLADLVSEGQVTPEVGAGDEALTANLALKRAQTLSGAGDYRAAARYLYLSSLLLLEERRLLRYDRSRTNHEYLRSLAHLPQLARILHDVIEIFDRVWYGYYPLDAAAYERYAARIAELNQQARQ
jgi:hypothetical protein